MTTIRPPRNFISAGVIASALAMGVSGITQIDLQHYSRHGNTDNKRQLGAYRGRNSIATGNRHGGAHEHKREIARRIRQQEVNDQRNFDRNYARI